jgi:iron complex outermembrane receptor protein
MKRFSRKSALLCGAATVAITWAGAAFAQATNFDVPSEDAVKAIPEFARQANIQIVAPADSLKGVRTPPVKGALDRHIALAKLLGGTKIEIASDDGQTVILKSRPADPPPARSAAAAPDDPPPAQATGLETITVTAERRETLLQETPIAITVLGHEDLVKNHVVNLLDITRLVPSLESTSEGDHGVATFTLRGIGNDADKTEYADPEVSLFVDNVYSPRAEGATVLLLDMDNIQVLRGPQGTLWGRNSTVGAVNMVTAKPVLGDEFVTSQLGTGSYSRLEARVAVNLPVADNLAFRLAFAQVQHDGYVAFQAPNVPSLTQQMVNYTVAGGAAKFGPFQPINTNLFTQIGPRYDAQDQSALRLSALYEPLSNLTWNVSFEYFRDRGTPSANLMENPRPGEPFWSGLFDVAPQLSRNSYTLRSRFDYAINDDISVAYIAGYNWFSGSSDFDQDSGTHIPQFWADPATTFQDDRTDDEHYFSYSHEVDLQSVGHHTVDWTLGLYYEGERNDIRFDIPIMNGTQSGTVSWQGSFIQPKETVQSEAAFGQATWNVSDDLRLTGGFRYSHDYRTNDGGTDNGWLGNATCPQTPISPSTNPLTEVGTNGQPCFSSYEINTAHHDFSQPTYLARADYNVNSGFLIYASASTGYKSGGLQDGGSVFNPETDLNYEVGTKNTFFGGNATLNNAFYYMEFWGYQIAAPVTLPDGDHTLDFSNVQSTTRVYGLESELTALVTPDDQVQVGLALLHTRLGTAPAIGDNDYANLPICTTSKLTNTCIDATGFAMPHAPAVSFTLQYQHTFHLWNGADLIPRVNFHWESMSWLSPLHDTIGCTTQNCGDRQTAWTRTDFSLTYDTGKHWSAEFYVSNLEDGKIKTNNDVTGDNIYYGQYMPPRTFGGNIYFHF